MTKLIVLTPDVAHAQDVVDTLRADGIDDEHLHTVAHEHTPLDDLPAPALDEHSDAIPAMIRGAGIGAVTGMLLGLGAVVVAPAGVVVAGGAAAAGTLGGASFGAFASALIGVSVPNSQLDEFENALAEGSVLLIVEVPDDRVDSLTRTINEAHPSADVKGEQDLLPPPV